jgi:hypothetical protein
MAIDLTALRASARRKISHELTSSDYSDANLDANLNEWYREILIWALEVTGIWEIRGEQAFTNFVLDQVEYVLPTSDFLILNRVEVKYPNSSTYVKADRIDDKQVDNSAFINNEISLASEARPVYRVFDNSLFIYPKPSAAVTNGISIEYLKDVTDLATGTDQPDLNPTIRKALAIGAAYEFASTEEMDKLANRLMRRLVGSGDGDTASLKYAVQLLAAQRDRSVKTQLTPRRQSFR